MQWQDQATDELVGNLLGGAGEEGLREGVVVTMSARLEYF